MANDKQAAPERTAMRFIPDEDLMPWVTTHGTAQEGGRKTHFGSYEGGPLCAVFYTRQIGYEIGDKRITKAQFEKLRSKFKHEFSMQGMGITRHVYKYKE